MIYDVYGYAEPSLGDQRGRLAEALGVQWVKHESDYRGVYFAARPRTGAGKLRLQANDLRDGDDEYHQEPDFPKTATCCSSTSSTGPTTYGPDWRRSRSGGSSTAASWSSGRCG